MNIKEKLKEIKEIFMSMVEVDVETAEMVQPELVEPIDVIKTETPIETQIEEPIVADIETQIEEPIVIEPVISEKEIELTKNIEEKDITISKLQKDIEALNEKIEELSKKPNDTPIVLDTRDERPMTFAEKMMRHSQEIRKSRGLK